MGQLTITPFDTSIRYVPDIVVAARTLGDVESALRLAARQGAPLSVLGTGHGVLHDVTRGVLLCLDGLAGVSVDVERRTARVGAGTTWSEVLAATTPHGLAGLCGSASGVGVIGYLLGGGIGPLARSFGFAADHVRSIEIVTPAHGLLTATPEHHPELFWALRGGKGGFGVVTAVTIDLFPLAEVYGGGLYFAADAARDVLTAVTEWAPSLPETATASVAMLRLPALPDLPEPLRGRFVIHVRFASTAEPAEGERQLAPVRLLGTPLADTVGVLAYARIGEVHGDPTSPIPVMCGGATLDTLDEHVVDALLDVAGPQRQLPVAQVELRSLGGAVARPAEVPNAVGGRDAAWNLFVAAAPVPDLAPEQRRAGARAVLDSVARWRAPVNLVNFVGRANNPGELHRSWTTAQHARLDAVRAAADPDAVVPFGGLQPVS